MHSKIKTPIEQVLEYYPDAKPVKIKKHVEIRSNDRVLGQGKNNRCAWKAASRNIND